MNYTNIKQAQLNMHYNKKTAAGCWRRCSFKADTLMLSETIIYNHLKKKDTKKYMKMSKYLRGVILMLIQHKEMESAHNTSF